MFRWMICAALVSTLWVTGVRAQDACSGTPHLIVGQQAQVILAGAGSDGLLRVRAVPGTDAPGLVDMVSGEVFNVVDGPQCAGDYWWWRVVTGEGIGGWSAEGTAGSYFADPLDTPTTDPLPVPRDRQIKTLGDGTAEILAWSPSGRTLAVSGSQGVWLHSASLDRLKPLPAPGAITALDWNGELLAGGGTDGSLTVWNATTSQVVSVMSASILAVRALSFSPDGTRIASASVDSVVGVWDVASAQQIATFQGEGTITSVEWSPDGTQIALSAYAYLPDQPLRNRILFLDAETLAVLRDLDTFTADQNTVPILGVRWEPDSQGLIIGSGYQFWRWDAASGAVDYYAFPMNIDTPVSSFDLTDQGLVWVYTYAAEDGPASYLEGTAIDTPELLLGIAARAISGRPGRSLVAITHNTTSLLLVDTQTGQIIRRVDDYRVPVVTWDDAGQVVINAPAPDPLDAAIQGKTVTLHGGQIALDIEQPCGPLDTVRSFSVSPDASRIAVVALTVSDVAWETGRGCFTLWDAASGAFLALLDTPPLLETNSGMSLFVDYAIDSLTWTPDSAHLTVGPLTRGYGPFAVGGYGGFYLWDLSGRLIFMDSSAQMYGFDSAWSPDYARFAIWNEGTLTIWDAATLQPLASAPTVAADVSGLRWSVDGTRLAAHADRQDVVIWDAATGAGLVRLTGRTESAGVPTWSADGTRLAAPDPAGRIHIWDTSSSRLLMTLNTARGSVYTLSWSPDGTRLVSTTDRNVAIVWDVTVPSAPQ